MPTDDADLRYWLENMVWHHRFTLEEVVAAIGPLTGSTEDLFRTADPNAPQRERRRRRH